MSSFSTALAYPLQQLIPRRISILHIVVFCKGFDRSMSADSARPFLIIPFSPLHLPLPHVHAQTHSPAVARFFRAEAGGAAETPVFFVHPPQFDPILFQLFAVSGPFIHHYATFLRPYGALYAPLVLGGLVHRIEVFAPHSSHPWRCPHGTGHARLDTGGVDAQDDRESIVPAVQRPDAAAQAVVQTLVCLIAVLPALYRLMVWRACRVSDISHPSAPRSS